MAARVKGRSGSRGPYPRVLADKPRVVRVPAARVVRGEANAYTVAPSAAAFTVPAVASPTARTPGAPSLASPALGGTVRAAGTTLLVPAHIRGVGMVRAGATPVAGPVEPTVDRRRVLGRRIG